MTCLNLRGPRGPINNCNQWELQRNPYPKRSGTGNCIAKGNTRYGHVNISGQNGEQEQSQNHADPWPVMRAEQHHTHGDFHEARHPNDKIRKGQKWRHNRRKFIIRCKMRHARDDKKQREENAKTKFNISNHRQP